MFKFDPVTKPACNYGKHRVVILRVSALFGNFNKMFHHPSSSGNICFSNYLWNNPQSLFVDQLLQFVKVSRAKFWFDFENIVHVLRLLDLAEDGEVLDHQLGGRLGGREVKQADMWFLGQFSCHFFWYQLLIGANVLYVVPRDLKIRSKNSVKFY